MLLDCQSQLENPGLSSRLIAGRHTQPAPISPGTCELSHTESPSACKVGMRTTPTKDKRSWGVAEEKGG
eukprot:2942711-Rhodomonas_salina.2